MAYEQIITVSGSATSGQVPQANGSGGYVWADAAAGVSPSSSTPAMDGTATVGSSNDYARGDHVHPTDTSRAPLASPDFTGTPTAPTATAGTNNTQIATTAFVTSAIEGFGPGVDPSSDTPLMDGTAAVGTSDDYARGDHVHPTDTSRAASDHVHGNLTNGGAITATAVTPASGDAIVFVDSSDSSKIVKSDATFDGSTTTKALSQKGTFETFLTSHQSLSSYAPLASPTLTGTPKSTTAAYGTNTTQIATTAFVDAAKKASSIEYIEGTQTESTNVWIGVTVEAALYTGKCIAYKLPYAGTSTGATLNLTLSGGGTTGAKTVYYNNSACTTHYPAGSVIHMTYDGTAWRCAADYNSNSNTIPSAFCDTAAATAAKTASCSNFTLNVGAQLPFDIRYSNTSATAITMNVNSTGAKTIAINGVPSSTSNYSLPAGAYIAYYDGTYWQFRTDGMLPDYMIASQVMTVTANTTLGWTHRGKYIYVNSSSARTITIPANSTTAFPIGTEIEFCRYGTGTVTFAAASGVTLYSAGSVKTIGIQYGTAGLKKVATDTWILAGALA